MPRETVNGLARKNCNLVLGRWPRRSIPRAINPRGDQHRAKIPRARRRAFAVSGLRASVFGDLILVDHTDVKIDSKTYVALVIIDGATNFLRAYPQKS